MIHVRALADDIGSRPAGSEAEAKAADYIGEQLSDYGYNVQQPPFQFEAFVDLGTTLEVTAPEARALETVPLRPTISGLAEGQLVAAGIGRPEEFPPDAAGKIVLLERGELRFAEKVANAAAAGAIAAIIYNNEPRLFQGQLEGPSAIPAVGISQDDGQSLLALMQQGAVTVRLDVRVESGTRTSHNVVARPASGLCDVIVGGHYDSVPQGPGANDNASGTATVIEIARVLAAEERLDNVCFALFGAEEIGLVGSLNFVEALPLEERRTVRGMVNFDQIAVGSQWFLAGSPNLTAIAAREATSAGFSFSVADLPAGAGSDHASFIEAGIPAILFNRQEDPRYHSPDDVSRFVEPGLLAEAARMGLAVIEELLQGQ